MNKSPAFQFYPSDYLSSQRVQMMTLEEEGAYIRLLCYCWQHGNIPEDSEQIARLIGKGASTTLASMVKPMFVPSEEQGRLTHDRLESEKVKQSEWRKKSSEGGKKSAELRKGGSRVVEAPYQPKGNSSSSSSSSVLEIKEIVNTVDSSEPAKPKKKAFEPPALEMCLEYGKNLEMSEKEIEAFFNSKESNGWMVGKNKMKCWKAGMRYWHSQSTNFVNKQSAQSKPERPIWTTCKKRCWFWDEEKNWCKKFEKVEPSPIEMCKYFGGNQN